MARSTVASRDGSIVEDAPRSGENPHAAATAKERRRCRRSGFAFRFLHHGLLTTPAAGKLRPQRLQALYTDGRAMWVLRTVAEGIPEKTFRIMPGTVRTLGRATGADFIVDAALVSRVHCRFTSMPDGGSRSATSNANGTFVNGQRTEVARLASGDKVQIGRVEVVALRDNE